MSKFKIWNIIEESLNKDRGLAIFLGLEIILYSIFMLLDITGNYTSISNVFKYISILICFLFVLLPAKRRPKAKLILGSDSNDLISDLVLLRLALFFTLISDYFLLFTDYYAYGLITFVIVQVLYLFRINRWKTRSKVSYVGKYKKVLPFLYIGRNLLITIIILTLLLGLLISKLGLSLSPYSQLRDSIKDLLAINNTITILIILAIFYFVSLILNLIDTIRLSRHSNKLSHKIFATGLFLFLLCDINVGLFNLSKHQLITSNMMFVNLSISSNKEFIFLLYDISSILMWFFYLPSQVLITLSKYDIGHN